MTRKNRRLIDVSQTNFEVLNCQLITLKFEFIVNRLQCWLFIRSSFLETINSLRHTHTHNGKVSPKTRLSFANRHNKTNITVVGHDTKDATCIILLVLRISLSAHSCSALQPTVVQLSPAFVSPRAHVTNLFTCHPVIPCCAFLFFTVLLLLFLSVCLSFCLPAKELCVSLQIEFITYHPLPPPTTHARRNLMAMQRR